MAVVRVLSKDGESLAPTTRCDYVRYLLKEGKAKVVGHDPFTIQLLYETANIVNTNVKKGNVTTMTKVKSKKNIAIAIAMVMVLAIASIAAYFTATDSETNSFTLGEVKIDQTEPNWDPEEGTDITPNKEIAKDPQVTNTSTKNPAYVFTMVAVPKKVVKVAVTPTGIGPAAGNANPGIDGVEQMTQIFQLNAAKNGTTTMAAANMLSSIAGKTSTGVVANSAKHVEAAMPTKSVNADALPIVGKASNSNVWSGVDTWDSHWYLLDVNNTAASTGSSSALNGFLNDYNIYLFAYGSATEMSPLAVGATTEPVFNSVTVANAINVNDLLTDENNIDYDSALELTAPQMLIKSFAIQTDNLADNDNPTVDPAGVWTILNQQDGAYRAFADEMTNLTTDWQGATSYAGQGKGDTVD